MHPQVSLGSKGPRSFITGPAESSCPEQLKPPLCLLLATSILCIDIHLSEQESACEELFGKCWEARNEQPWGRNQRYCAKVIMEKAAWAVRRVLHVNVLRKRRLPQPQAPWLCSVSLSGLARASHSLSKPNSLHLPKALERSHPDAFRVSLPAPFSPTPCCFFQPRP